MAMSVEQAYQILSKFHGYTGPRTKRAISQFVNARDLPVAVKNRGGLIGMQQGGATALEGQQPPGPIPDELKEKTFVDGEIITGDFQTLGVGDLRIRWSGDNVVDAVTNNNDEYEIELWGDSLDSTISTVDSVKMTRR